MGFGRTSVAAKSDGSTSEHAQESSTSRHRSTTNAFHIPKNPRYRIPVIAT